MRVSLAYGRGQLELELPESHSVHVLEKPSVTPLGDPAAALSQALERPIGAPRLGELASGRRDAVIVISDATRPVPNALFLPPLLAALRDAGIPPSAVTVQVATGLHRPCTPGELEEMLGSELARSLHVVQHDAHDRDAHAQLGASRHGIPIHIDRFYLERDLKILTGLIEPHLMAGYSGVKSKIWMVHYYFLYLMLHLI